MVDFVVPRKTASVVTQDATAAAGTHTPVDASGGARTVTLPTGKSPGASLSIEKIDASTNAVTVTGNVRGVAGVSIALTLRYESIELIADAAGSWRPIANNLPPASLATTSVTLWKASTAYKQGQAVLNPAGAVVTALADFTSGSSYDATKWSTPAAGGTTDYNALTNKPTLGTAAAQPVTAFDAAGAATSAQAAAVQRANHTGTQPTSTIAGLDSTLQGKADLVGGVVPTAQLPALAFTATWPVASQAAMLALTTSQVQPGDIAVRTDGAGSFILNAADPSQLSSWVLLNSPTDLVSSVNGQQGTVVLGKGDVALGNVDNTSDLTKPVSTATQTALNGKVPTTRTVAGKPLTSDVTLAKTDVGLDQVSNTADVDKPVSTAQQNALNMKAPLASPIFTGTPKIGSSPVVKASDLPRQFNVDGLLLTPVDGGVEFFRRFRFPWRTDPYFFPLGLHFPAINSASDIATHLASGINYYHWLAATSDLSLLAGGSLPAMLQWSDWGASYSSWKANGAIAGISLDDERDMVYNGSGGDQTQGYVDQQAQLDAVTKDGRFIHANYSKGVAFYGSDASAARYVNDFTDSVSIDVYWMTDQNTWQQYQGGKYVNGSTAPLTQAQGQMGYLYGAIVNRVRSLASPAGGKPVFNCIELGHSAGDTTSPTITAAQIKSAAWHSIIAGARGLIYFDQAFTTGNAIADADIVKNQPAVRTALATTNALITSLAPVLNAPTVFGFCTIPTGIAATVKYYNGAYYLLAGSAQTASQSAAFTVNVAGYTTATVVGEARSIALTANAFSDTFADQNAIHIYKLAKG